MSIPLVSVVIATRNRAQDIMQALKIVRAQDYPNIEIVVVNDGSTDNTQVVLDAEQGIVVVHNPARLWLQRSLNIGCKLAKGKYIARLDDHDIWTDPAKISKQVQVLEANHEVGVVGTGIKIGSRIIINPLTDQSIRNQMLFRCPFSHVTVVFRRDLFERVGGYDENLKYSEDWDLWMRIGQYAKLQNLSDVTTIVKEAVGSLTDEFYVSQLKQNKLMLAKYTKYYPRKWLASLYHFLVSVIFRVVKKDSFVHRTLTKVYTRVFAHTKDS